MKEMNKKRDWYLHSPWEGQRKEDSETLEEESAKIYQPSTILGREIMRITDLPDFLNIKSK